MKILIAMDSFKGNLTSLEAGEAVKRGVLRSCPDADIGLFPMADGGEGTVDAFVAALGGQTMKAQVTGPLGKPVEAAWGLLPDGSAVIELASASGLPLVPFEQRDPLKTTTTGTGELVKKALDQGCRHIFVGLGGSATNDGAIGLLTALGARFLDGANGTLVPTGASLEQVACIDLSCLDPRIGQCRLSVISDVTHRLCGDGGAAAVFGPQKGADADAVAKLDRGLKNLARIIEKTTGRSVLDLPGGAAAGGVGAGLAGLLNVTLEPGIDVVMALSGLDCAMTDADLLFTGEGRVDAQSIHGKVISGLAKRARLHGVPLVALVGALKGSPGPLLALGLTALFPIGSGPSTFRQACQRSPIDLERTASQVVRLMVRSQRRQFWQKCQKPREAR